MTGKNQNTLTVDEVLGRCFKKLNDAKAEFKELCSTDTYNDIARKFTNLVYTLKPITDVINRSQVIKHDARTKKLIIQFMKSPIANFVKDFKDAAMHEARENSSVESIIQIDQLHVNSTDPGEAIVIGPMGVYSLKDAGTSDEIIAPYQMGPTDQVHQANKVRIDSFKSVFTGCNDSNCGREDLHSAEQMIQYYEVFVQKLDSALK